MAGQRPARASRQAVVVEVEHVLLGVVLARRAAQRLRLTPFGPQLLALADAFEAALPATVPQACLARALGVTPQAVQRWSARGLLPLARPRPGALPGVPADVAVDVLDDVVMLRWHRPGRAFARALRRRARRLRARAEAAAGDTPQ